MIRSGNANFQLYNQVGFLNDFLLCEIDTTM